MAAAQHDGLAQLQRRHDELLAQVRALEAQLQLQLQEGAGGGASLPPPVTPFPSRAAPEASTRKSAVRRALDDMAAMREASAAPAGAKRPGDGSNAAMLSAQGFAAKRAAIQYAVDEALAALAGRPGGGDGGDGGEDDATRLGGDPRSPTAATAAASPFHSPRAASSSAAAATATAASVSRPSAATIVAAELGLNTPSGPDARLAPLRESEEYLSAYGVNPTKMVLLKVRLVGFQSMGV